MLVGVLSGGCVQFILLRRCRLIKLNLSWEVALSCFYVVFPLVSLTNIGVISIERFHATFRPFRHRLIKRLVYVVAIVVVWVFPLIVSVIWGWGGGWMVELLYLNWYHLYILESYCLLCLIVTFVSYTSIFFKSRFGAHPQRHCAAAGSLTVSGQRIVKYSIKIVSI